MQPRGQLTASVDTAIGTEDILSRPSTCCASPTFSIADILASSFQVCSSAETNCESKLSLTKSASPLADSSPHSSHLYQRSRHFGVHHSQLLYSPSYPDGPRENANLHEDLKVIPLTERNAPLAGNRQPTPELPNVNAKGTSAVNTSTADVRPPSTSTRTSKLVKSGVFRVDIPGTVDVGISYQSSANLVEKPEPCAPKDTMKTGVSCFNCGSCAVDAGRRVPSAITDTLNILMDAARCVRAETQLEEAEAVLEHLIAKFAEPSDLYTSWENLVSDHKLGEDTGTAKLRSLDSCESPSLAAISFSPIFRLLLSQPESCIFPDLYRPTAPGRQLQELCNQLATAIRRTKRKLRVLQRMKSNQSQTTLVKDDLKQNLSRNVDRSSSYNRRTDFISRLRCIWPEFRELDISGLSAKQPETNTIPSLNTHLSKPSPHIYTNPMECPLSLLSFVSNLIDSRLSRSNEIIVPNRMDTGENMSGGSSSAEPRFHDDMISSMKRSGILNEKDSSTQVTTQRPHDESKWLSAAKCNRTSSFDTTVSVPLSFSPSSASPSSCSTNSCGQQPTSNRPFLPVDKRSRWMPSDQRLPSADIEFEGFPECSALRSRRRPRKRTSHPLRSKRKRLVREDESPHTTSATNVQRMNKFVEVTNKSNESPVTLTIQQAISKVPSPSSTQFDAMQSTWMELNVIVRDSESSEARLGWKNKPDYPGHMSISAIHSPSATSDIVTTHSAPYTSFTDSSSTTSQLIMDRSMDFLSPSGHGDSSHFSSDEHGWSNTTRPPTPDIRRSDLDVTDLSDGTRVLIIEGTHLRAGTLYLCRPMSFPSFSAENRREYLFRIHLDADRSCVNALSTGFMQTRHSSSPARIASCESPTGVTPKKRRQSDMLLHGWQVMQQAVLEVFPASLRHLPPGTRVCAAWSEQLASNLYPGTVVEAESDDQVQMGCVAVDFDDGDHRQVPLHNIRLLPDHFANLHQLANEAGVEGLMNHIISPARFPPGDMHRISSDAALPRVRRHSAVCCESPISIPALTARRGWNKTVRSRRICPQLAIDAAEPPDEFRNDTNSPETVEFGGPEMVASKNSSSTEVSLTSYPATVKAEQMMNMDVHGTEVSPKMDPEVPFDVVSSASDSSDSQGWSIMEKLKRRKHGRLCCRSIVRETDGSVVSIGDAVEFSSENDEAYLGEIREIQWNESINNFVVVAAWFYHPTETGAAGSRITSIKGALFATAHMDENEARCINRRVTVLTSYAEYRQRMGTIGSEVDANRDAGVGGKPDAPMHLCSELQTTIVPDPFELGDTQDAQSTATSERTEDAVYFVAGKYDPVNLRVLSWDPDIEKLIKRNK